MGPQPVIYRLRGGKTVSGHDAQSIIHSLMSRSNTMPKSQRAYMNAVARRCHVWDRSIIPTDTAESFVQALVKHGFLTPIKRKSSH